jgi:hypothetical protein
MTREEISIQLDWLKENNFGGVEIAFVYPLPGKERGMEFLSEEWTELVCQAKYYCETLGLTCDFTLGTLWPFGGSFIEKKHAARNYWGISQQRLNNSWEQGFKEPGYILNHLSSAALKAYCDKILQALEPALEGTKSALFCDSWEADTEKIWTRGFAEAFLNKYNYDISPYMDDLEKFPQIRYDYRKLVSDYVIHQFYEPFTRFCQERGGFSRIQCHGAPADLIAAYAQADVPETEALLFDPHFSSFAVSAAAISGSVNVSAETFSCIYGWLPYPAIPPYLKKEQTADLKLVADALFANGTNLIIWHGMPFNPQQNEFYATTHVGPDSRFAAELPAFNTYLKAVSEIMSQGKIYSDIAVYLPLEDNWQKHRLPEELLRPSASFYWEMHYQRFPEELQGYHPLWISGSILSKAEFKEGKLICGAAEYRLLYLNVTWLDEESLDEILRLGTAGLPICLKRIPQKPGWIQNWSFKTKLDSLLALANVSDFISETPVIKGDPVPEFCIRKDEDKSYIFFGHPGTHDVHYPLQYGQSFCVEIINIPVIINLYNLEIPYLLSFNPYQSIVLQISPSGTVEDITPVFIPAVPVPQ